MLLHDLSSREILEIRLDHLRCKRSSPLFLSPERIKDFYLATCVGWNLTWENDAISVRL